MSILMYYLYVAYDRDVVVKCVFPHIFMVTLDLHKSMDPYKTLYTCMYITVKSYVYYSDTNVHLHVYMCV